MHTWLLLLYCLTALGAYGVEALADGSRGIGYLFLHTSLVLICVGVAWSLRREPERGARAVMWAAIVSRLCLLGVTPFTTHDVDRYMWDGKVALEGHDPYSVTPEDSHFENLYEQGWFVAPEHRPYPTIYPPLALAAFSASALVGPSYAAWVWKALVTFAAICMVWVLWRLSVACGSYHGLIWASLHPLGLLEVGVGAHLDTLAALGVACGLWAFASGRPGALGSGLGIGIVAKLSPLVMLAALIKVPRWRQAAMGVCAVLIPAYGGAFAMGWVPLGSLPEFASTWRFGSLIDWGLSQFDLSRHALVSPILFVLGGAWVAWRRPKIDFARLATALMAWAFFVSPVLFPWYLVVLLPLMVLAPSAILIVWMSVVPFTYEVIDAFDESGIWAPSEWPMWVTSITLGLAIVIDYRRGFWNELEPASASNPSHPYGV